MKRGITYALVFMAAVGLGHYASVVAAPRVIMQVALTKMSQGGKRINSFQFGPRTTEKSRGVVRP